MAFVLMLVVGVAIVVVTVVASDREDNGDYKYIGKDSLNQAIVGLSLAGAAVATISALFSPVQNWQVCVAIAMRAADARNQPSLSICLAGSTRVVLLVMKCTTPTDVMHARMRAYTCLELKTRHLYLLCMCSYCGAQPCRWNPKSGATARGRAITV